MTKSILITGGSSGIGAATAQEAARRGWAVYIGFHQGRQRALALAEALRASGGTAYPVPIRLAENSDFAEAIRMISEKTKTLDALVLSASPAPHQASFLKTESQEFLLQFQTNVIANHQLLIECWKHFFRKAKKGHVLGVLSVAALKDPWPHMTSYVIGKRALLALLECSLAEFGKSGLRASVLYPDYTETPMWSEKTHPLVLEAARAKRPGGRFLNPAQIAIDVMDLLESERTDSSHVEEKIILGEPV